MTQQGGILLMELSTLVKMSNTYGSNPAYVLAGGGNTSVKDDTTLYVKGSGTQLATIKAEEFVKMDRARLNEIMKTEYPADDVKRESAYLADVMAAVTDEDKTKRPSVEALLHNLFAYTYVLHVHPTLINGLTCGKGAKALCEELLGKDVLWIDICKPGYTLARICFEKMNAYKEETGKDVQVLLLQNHGIFVAADTVEEIGVLFDGVIGKLEKQVKRTADVSDAVTPEKEQAAQKLEFPYNVGVTITKASFYTQTTPETKPVGPELVYKWQAYEKGGATSTSMECSVLFCVGASLGIRTSSVMISATNFGEYSNDADDYPSGWEERAIEVGIEAMKIMIRKDKAAANKQ